MRTVAALGVLVVLLALGACEREQKAIEKDLPAARVTKARGDVQQIAAGGGPDPGSAGAPKPRADVQEVAAAVGLYQASVGALPASLEALTQAQTSGGVTTGPLMASIPAPPSGWSASQYTKQGADRFTVSASGGGVTVSAPE